MARITLRQRGATYMWWWIHQVRDKCAVHTLFGQGKHMRNIIRLEKNYSQLRQCSAYSWCVPKKWCEFSGFEKCRTDTRSLSLGLYIVYIYDEYLMENTLSPTSIHSALSAYIVERAAEYTQFAKASQGEPIERWIERETILWPSFATWNSQHLCGILRLR